MSRIRFAVEADPEISVFLDVRELLLEPDSALRFARRAFSCAAKEYGTTRQCDSSNIRAKVLARDAVVELKKAELGNHTTE